MARPPSWLQRLSSIRKTVENSTLTHYTAADLRRMFQLQERAARAMFEMLPTVKLGGGDANWVERQALLRFLERAAESENVHALFAQMRSEKERPSRRKPRMLVRRELIKEASLDSLPPTISLSKGMLNIIFQGKMEFLESAAVLIGAIDRDWDEFLAKYVPNPEQDEAQASAREDLRELQKLFEELRQMEANHNKKMN